MRENETASKMCLEKRERERGACMNLSVSFAFVISV
jgi:hypothetical protein